MLFVGALLFHVHTFTQFDTFTLTLRGRLFRLLSFLFLFRRCSSHFVPVNLCVCQSEFPKPCQSKTITCISQDATIFRLVCRKKTEEDPKTEVTEIAPKIADDNKSDHLEITDDTLKPNNKSDAINV